MKFNMEQKNEEAAEMYERAAGKMKQAKKCKCRFRNINAQGMRPADCTRRHQIVRREQIMHSRRPHYLLRHPNATRRYHHLV